MTRENKVALVVGFALVLFVGILISDHFSKARQQQPADLLPASHTPSAEKSPTLLTDVAPPAAQRFELPLETTATNESTDLVLPPAERFVAEPTPHDATALAAPPLRVHEVRIGETLELICRHYYGDVSLADELADHNGLDDPDSIQAGRSLDIPDPTQLSGDEPVVAAASAPDAPAYDSYRIQPGDSLSELAQRFLSSATRWRELYELNRDVISDPDQVRAGTVIRVPREPKAT